LRPLRAWIAAAGITDGGLFRRVDRHGNAHGALTAQSVRLVVRDAATRAGLDADRFAGHSLRAGLATAAAAAGVSERAIMAQTGHKSLTVARRYIRHGSVFRDNAAAAVLA
jgi:integrase